MIKCLVVIICDIKAKIFSGSLMLAMVCTNFPTGGHQSTIIHPFYRPKPNAVVLMYLLLNGTNRANECCLLEGSLYLTPYEAYFEGLRPGCVFPSHSHL